jgi:hypothetical protein
MTGSPIASTASRTGSRQEGATGPASTRVVLLAAGVYAVIVLIGWLPFNPHSGMPYETYFPYNSEISSILGGFLYAGDPLRVHTNTFYHLSYLIGEAFGVSGSYLPYQVVWALLWWARGLLVFLLVRRFFPDCLTLAYVAGGLVVVHASDTALQWVGQMNQFGFIFWMLLAFYLFSLATDAAGSIAAVFLGVGALAAEYLSLWSYESQILLLLVFPLVLLVHGRGSRFRLTAIAIGWYSLLILYVSLTVQRYHQFAGQTYQESVMRKSFALRDLLSDLIFNVRASLEFWTWPQKAWSATAGGHEGVLSLLAALIFVAGGAAILRLAREGGRRHFLVPEVGTWWAVLIVGLVFVVLSFPVYLLLDSARQLWRTQFLSGIGSGLVLTGVLGLLCSYPSFVPRVMRVTAFLVLGGMVVRSGTFTAIQAGAFERSYWERHRSAIMNILHAAPSVKPDTVIAVLNVPRSEDPFGDEYWLELAVRLIYPGIPVAGVYFFDDGKPAPGNTLQAEGASWTWKRNGLPPPAPETPIANTVIVDARPKGADSLVKAMPSSLCHTPCAVGSYNPDAVISGSISPRVARRYMLPSGTFRVATGIIRVRRATYGQSCYGTALPAGYTNTVTPGNVTRIVDRICGERDDCDVKVTNALFGDPAPYCAKDFRVQWTCSDGKSEEVTASAEALGKTIHLHCSSAQGHEPS